MLVVAVIACLGAAAVAVAISRRSRPAPSKVASPAQQPTPAPLPIVPAKPAAAPTPVLRAENPPPVTPPSRTTPTKSPSEHVTPKTSSQPALVEQAKEAFGSGQLDLALRLAKEALAQRADAEASVVVGNVHFKRRAYGEAARSYDEALKLQPGNEKILKRRETAQKLASSADSTQ